MELFAEVVMQLLFFFLELVWQFLIEAGFNWVRFRRSEPWFFFFSLSVIFGVAAGVLSVFILPKHLVTAVYLRWLNLLVSPLIIARLFVWIQERRKPKPDAYYLLAQFGNAYIFAFVYILMRVILLK